MTNIQLAKASLDGQDCDFALRDALLEAGLNEFAAHYSDGWHNKRICIVSDFLAGRIFIADFPSLDKIGKNDRLKWQKLNKGESNV